MAAVIQNITLDFSRENNNPVLAKRGDAASRFLKVSFTQLGEPMQIPSAATVSLNVRKNDGHYASSGGIINEDGTATVPIISQMLAVDGDAKADVRVIGADTSKLTTFDFILRVQETTVPDEVPISTDEFNDLVLALSEVAGFAGVKAELEAARGTYGTVGERLDDVDADLYTHTGDIASLGGRLTTAEQSIGTLDSGLTGALQRITNSEEAIPVMQDDISGMQDDISTLKSKSINKYGVRRAVASSSPILERVGDADGLTAAAGVGDTPATNDFDSIYPWSHMRRCNLDDNGNVTAYEGEPTYASNGSNGQVMVEIPRFYQKHETVDGYEYWWVCEMPLGGFRLSPAFIGSSGQVLDKTYIAAYDAGYDGTSKATSVAGAHPEVRRSRTSFRTIAQARGAGWQLLNIAMACDIMQFLFVVEFATLHCQFVMNGVISLPYTDTHAAAFTELAANRIVITNAQAASYVVGQSIEIGTSQGDGQIAKGRVITAITALADSINTALVFDGEAVDVTQGNLVYSSGWIAGGADSVVASSGSATSNLSGKSPFKWRGIENAWGNVFQWIDGVNILDHQAWISAKPAEYDDTIVAAPYKKLNFKNGTQDGYVKTLGEDINYPWARFPTEAGASATTYYSDYYYQKTELRACSLGGHFYNGTNAGLFYFSCGYAAWSSGTHVGARLSYKP